MIHSGFISVPSLTSGPRTRQVPLEHPVSCSYYNSPGSQSPQGLGLSSSSERFHLLSLCPPKEAGGLWTGHCSKDLPLKEAICRLELGSCPNQGPNKHLEFVRRFC